MVQDHWLVEINVHVVQRICKQGYRFLPNGNKDTLKLHITMQHVKSNVQSLIDLCVNTMSHQMKGVGNGRHGVRHLLPRTWKSIQE